MISINSFVIAACLDRLKSIVNLSIISPALRVALSIAAILDPCSEAAFSWRTEKIDVAMLFGIISFNISSSSGSKLKLMLSDEDSSSLNDTGNNLYELGIWDITDGDYLMGFVYITLGFSLSIEDWIKLFNNKKKK